MKKYYSILTLIVAALFCIIGYYAYQNFIKVKVENITPKYLNINISSDTTKLINSHKDQRKIVQLELQIEGEISDYVTIHFGEKKNLYKTELRLKKGKISTAHILDWHKKEAHLFIESPKNSHGKLEIQYQFIGLD